MEIIGRDKRLIKEWSTISKTDLVLDMLTIFKRITSAFLVRALKFSRLPSKIFAYSPQVRAESYPVYPVLFFGFCKCSLSQQKSIYKLSIRWTPDFYLELHAVFTKCWLLILSWLSLCFLHLFVPLVHLATEIYKHTHIIWIEHRRHVCEGVIIICIKSSKA